MTDNNKLIGRRNFLKQLGSSVVAASALLSGCSSDQSKSKNATTSQEKGNGKMTYRKDVHGTDVSLLCFGCMRFPAVKGDRGREDANNDLDQEKINKMTEANFWSPQKCLTSETSRAKLRWRCTITPSKSYKWII